MKLILYFNALPIQESKEPKYTCTTFLSIVWLLPIVNSGEPNKLRLAYPVTSKHKDNVSAAMRAMLEPVAEAVDSITYENDKEFSGHQQVNKSIKCKSYFAKPYRSWERGQNENANGLLRQCFPKSMKLTDVCFNEVKIAVHKLNTRPRKCLGFKTPNRCFLSILA